MIHIPPEFSYDASITSAILIIGLSISVVFKQSSTISIMIAKVLVDYALRIFQFVSKRSAHKYEASKLMTEWHMLKSKLKNGKIGHG